MKHRERCERCPARGWGLRRALHQYGLECGHLKKRGIPRHEKVSRASRGPEPDNAHRSALTRRKLAEARRDAETVASEDYLKSAQVNSEGAALFELLSLSRCVLFSETLFTVPFLFSRSLSLSLALPVFSFRANNPNWRPFASERSHDFTIKATPPRKKIHPLVPLRTLYTLHSDSDRSKIPLTCANWLVFQLKRPETGLFVYLSALLCLLESN